MGRMAFPILRKGEIMYTHCKRFLTLALTLALTISLHIPAYAATTFSDVPAGTLLYESVAYLTASGITNGTGGGQFSPDDSITIRQWAVMLDRAFGLSDTQDGAEFGQSSLTQTYRRGWLSLACLLSPDVELCRGLLYESAFEAVGLSIYDWSLYPGGVTLSDSENCLRVAVELDLCHKGADPLEVVTRGEAAVLLHAVLTQDLQVDAPPILSQFPIEDRVGVDLNDFLLELCRVPEPILERFQAEGWVFTVDHQHLAELSQKYHTSCTGAADYGERCIYVSAASSTLHEFGHFLDWALGFPTKHEALFTAEAEGAAQFLRDYALTSSGEYFAEYFAYFIRYRDNEAKIEQMERLTPQTYGYFCRLADSGWTQRTN